MPANISAEAIREFRDDGVTCLRGVLDSHWLRECDAAWCWSLDNPGPLAAPLLRDGSEARQDLCNPAALDRYRPLLEGAPLGDLAAELCGSREIWFLYEQVFHKSGGVSGRTPWHQDSPYLAVGGSHLLVLWITFEPIPQEISLELVRGSHLATLYDGSRFDPQDHTAPLFGTGELPRLPNIEAERERWDIVSFAVEPGDVVAFHPAVLHGGAPTTAACPERRTLSLRFFGDDAVYEQRPGPAGPFYQDLHPSLRPGDPFRHERFLKLR